MARCGEESGHNILILLSGAVRTRDLGLKVWELWCCDFRGLGRIFTGHPGSP